MKRLLNVVTPLHKRTERDYAGRMADRKVECMDMARQFSEQYWDGERRFGYGGYNYDGRWKVVAEKLLETYKIPPGGRVLDIGCGKGFLLHELQQLRPDIEVIGFDISDYAIENAKEEIRHALFVHDAAELIPYANDEFDLVISLTTLHNLPISKLAGALKEMDRVAKQKYLVVESYRNTTEMFNLQCWALTCEAFFRPDDWVWIFNKFGYQGDYEFIYFE
jgi:ubiquinone/menaquinone biosynthesis C-methylase UbiE